MQFLKSILFLNKEEKKLEEKIKVLEDQAVLTKETINEICFCIENLSSTMQQLSDELSIIIQAMEHVSGEQAEKDYFTWRSDDDDGGGYLN